MTKWMVVACVLGILAPGLAPGPARAQTDPQPELPKERLTIRTKDGVVHDFDVEVAKTTGQQTVGLMFRTSVPEDGGMLFIWPDAQLSNMWMKNTVSALDMVFINEDGTVRKVVEDTVPYSLAVISSDGPVRATLELKAGVTRKLGIHAGDKVGYKLFGTAKAG